MKAAVDHVQSQGASLRESSRLHNVPLETLRRRVNGTVAIDCRPGPNTVLTEEEETKLADYLFQMSEMGVRIDPRRRDGFGIFDCQEKQTSSSISEQEVLEGPGSKAS